MVFGDEKMSSASPSSAWIRHKHYLLRNKKIPAPPWGTRTEWIFCGTTLFAACATTSARCQHIGCPITQATRQKILRPKPFPTALHGPFADPLFALLSALQNSLWMRCQLYFRVNGFIFKLCLLYNNCVRLSRTFFHMVWTFFGSPKIARLCRGGYHPPARCKISIMYLARRIRTGTGRFTIQPNTQNPSGGGRLIASPTVAA